MTSDFRIYFVTWNVGEMSPTKDFTNLLSLNSKVLPNMYAIGLQELKSSTVSMVIDAVYDDPWTLALTDCLAAKGYVRIDSLRLVGMHLALFVQRPDLPFISGVESTYTRAGFRGFLGTKGAVSVRLDVHGVSVCIINAHFTAHQENTAQRIKDYSLVIESQRFLAADTKTVLDHDYVFFFGDLNFRIDGIPNAEVRSRIADHDLQYLWKYDQLNNARKDELILVDFVEGPLNFPPTFKYNTGSHVYDTSSKNRVPSWCDRVLWHVHKDAFTGVELDVSQLRYTSVDEYVDSDHKPVVAEFDIKVLSRTQPLPVLFEPLGRWNLSVDNSISYTVSSDVTVSTRDWIGLYKSNYKHWHDYATYVWASVAGDDVKDGTNMYTVTFEEPYLRKLPEGSYYLAYYSVAKRCIIGYSDALQLSMDDESSSEGDENDIDDEEIDDTDDLIPSKEPARTDL